MIWDLRDTLWAVAVLLLIGALLWHDHEIRVNAISHENAALEVQSQQIASAAEIRMALLNQQHKADLEKVQNDYERVIQANSDANAADLKRLRSAYANLKASTLLGSSSSPAAAAASSWAESFERLGGVSSELAAALRADDASLTACRTERNLLTGKGGPQ